MWISEMQWFDFSACFLSLWQIGLIGKTPRSHSHSLYLTCIHHSGWCLIWHSPCLLINFFDCYLMRCGNKSCTKYGWSYSWLQFSKRPQLESLHQNISLLMFVRYMNHPECLHVDLFLNKIIVHGGVLHFRMVCRIRCEVSGPLLSHQIVASASTGISNSLMADGNYSISVDVSVIPQNSASVLDLVILGCLEDFHAIMMLLT